MRALASALDDSDAHWALTLAHEDMRAGFEFYGYVSRVSDTAFLA